MCELLVGLDDVDVLSVVETGGRLEVMVETRRGVRPTCGGCGQQARVKDRPVVGLVDLPFGGRPCRLRWRKRPWQCYGSWTEICHRIASPRQIMTRRAGQWATHQVGRIGRTVADVAAELGCDWHTINDTVIAWGTALLDADRDRVGSCGAVGPDETSFVRRGRYRRTEWATTITDPAGRRLLDVVPGRGGEHVRAWFCHQGERWRYRIRWATLDLSGGYRSVLADKNLFPNARLVAVE